MSQETKGNANVVRVFLFLVEYSIDLGGIK